MSEDWLESARRRKEEEEQKKNATGSGDDWLDKARQKRFDEDVGKVDQDYIDLFLKTANDYFGTSEEEFSKLGWGNASSSYETRINAKKDLDYRQSVIRSWLESNKNRMDEETYNSFSGTLDSYNEGSASILSSFEDAANYFSQWSSQQDYDDYLAYQKDYNEKKNFNIDAGQKEIDALKQRRSELMRSNRPPASTYLTGGSAPSPAPYGAGLQGGGYDQELGELNRQISQKQQYLNLAKRVQDGEKLAGVVGNTDFKANSGYKSTAKQDKAWWETGIGDNQYEWINNQNGFRDKYESEMADLEAKSGASSQSGFYTGTGESAYYQKGYDKLTDTEVAIYNYHYATEGKGKAQEYLDSIQESLNQRKAMSMYSDMEDKTALEMVFGVQAGMDQFASGVSYLLNTDGEYIPQSAVQMAAQMVREDLGDVGPKLPDWMGGSTLGQVGYDAITTTANMAPSMLTSMAVSMLNPGAGALAGNALMFASSAGNAYQDAINRGYDKSQARLYGALVGGSEVGLQYLIGGISSLGGEVSGRVLNNMLQGVDNAYLRFIGKMGGSMISEGFEEGLQEVLTPMFSNMALLTDENVNWSDVAYSFLLGSLTAGVMEGPSTISTEVGTYQTGKQLQKADISAMRLAEIGSTFSADTVAYQLAGKVNESTGAYTMGRLFNEIGATMTEQNVSDITEALVKENMPREVARQNAEVMAQVVEGAQLSDTAIHVIEANEALSKAVKTTIIDQNATWFQRTKGYNETLMALAQEKTAPKASRTEQSAPGQENAPALDNVDAQNKVSSEAVSEVDTAPAKVKSISTIKDGQVTIKLEDGSEVNVKEADLDPEEGVFIETISQIDGISVNDANYILSTLKAAPGVNPQISAIGAKEVYKYGYYGISEDHIAKHGVFSSALTEAQRKSIYQTGKAARQTQVDAKQATVRNNRTVDQKATGKVHFEGDRSRLMERQSASLTAMERIADALGVQIHVFESQVNERGKRIGANGWYDPKDSSIHIDLHAGANGEGTMLFTLAHELTHHIRKWSPAKFKILSDFLMEEYGKKGVNVDGLVREQMNKAKRNGRTISYDTAYEEVVADSMETMLADGNVMEKLEKLKAKDKSLWQKIKDFISELAVKIRSVYEKMAPDSVEGRYVAEMVDSIEKLQELFTEALVDASTNYQSSLTPGEEGTIVNQNGDPVAHATADGTIQLSMRTYDEEGRKAFRDYLEKCVKSKKLTKAEMQDMLDGIEEIYGICKDFKDKYAPFSSWSDAAVVRDTHGKPVFSVVTPNGDYKMNLDFSLVCKKRRTLDAVFNEMTRRGIIDDFELGQKSVVKINEIIRKYGLETACALCFVDAKRFRQAAMADTFTSLYNELVESLVPEDQKGSIDHFNFSGYATIKKVEGGIDTWDNSKLDFSHINHVLKTYGDGTVEYKAAKYIKSNPEGRKLLLRGDFMSSKGFDAVKTQNQDILKLYNSKKGTGGPKAAFGDVQYMNEVIQKARWWTPKKAYEVGGVRIQSFSDYVPRMVFDYVQMIYDLAATKLPAHAYTKEALFVKQFGLTGVKINMSLIPAIADGGIAPGLDADGNYVWAGESFDFETAKEIQNAEGYTENCGTICVGVSYQHIVKLLGDPDIRMVIPYHKSGLNPIVAHMNKIAEFTDYTTLLTNPGGCQNTMDKNGSKVENDFNFNDVLRKTGDPKATVRQYLDWCAKHEYKPRFAEFAWHENYYKLIEDFTLFDKDGKYVPQREVRAVFPKDTDAFGSMKDLIKEGLEEDAIVEGKRDKRLASIVDEIQKAIPKTEAEIAEEQVAQADRDLEADEKKLSSRDYARQVDEVKNNTHDPLNHVYMGSTPVGIAKVLDLPKLPMLVTPQHIYSMAVSEAQAKRDGRFKSRNNYHNLGWDTVKNLPDYINKPVLLIKSNTDPNDATFVVVTAQTDHAGNPIIAAVKPNGRGNYFNIEFPTNFMLSGYGKDGIQGYVARAKTENRILFANKNSQKKNTPSVQFADNILSSDYSANLAQFKGIVKSKFTGTMFENSGLPKFSDRDSTGKQLSPEQQEFFKDSKARDKKGRLLTLYHGSDSRFTVYDTGKSDDKASIFLTDKRDVAQSYTYNRRDVDPYDEFDAHTASVEEVLDRYRQITPEDPLRAMTEEEMKSAQNTFDKGIENAMQKVGEMLTVFESTGYGRSFGYRNMKRMFDSIKNQTGGHIDAYYMKGIAENLGRIMENDFPSARPAVEAAQEAVATIAEAAEILSETEHGTVLYRGENARGWDKYVADDRIRGAVNSAYRGGVIPLYANITNPFEVDAEGKNWNKVKTPAAMLSTGRYSTTVKTREISLFAKENGYDGVIIRNLYDLGGKVDVGKKKSTILIAFDSNQIKSTANLNPTTDPDIRYSDRDESVSNRSLLANAFEGVAQTDMEKQKIQEYKGKISLIESEERKLQEMNEKIKDLSFKKGPKDTKAIRDLQFEAQQAANRISTYDKQLLRLEASKPLQDVLNREKKAAYKRAEQKGKEAMAAYRERATKTQRELMDKWQESRKRGIESREKTAVRHKIQNVVKELNDLLLNQSKKRHVPDNLKKAVADALALVNMDTVGAEERAAKYANLIAKETDPDKIDAYTATMENLLRQGEKMGQRLKELRDAYEEIQESDDPDIANAYDPVIAGCLKELAGSIGNTSLRNMTIEQLNDVYDMYRMVLTRVRDANKTLLDNIKENIGSLSSRVIGEVRMTGGEKKYRAAILDPVRKFMWNNLKPVYAMEHIGSSTLTKVFNNVRAGEDTWAKDVVEAREYYLDKSKKYGYDKWDFNKKHRFQSASELDFELTLEQMLSLYAYSKREQAGDHLKLGGFVFDSNIETYKEKGGKLKYKVNTADAHQITPEILAEITGKLTKEQKGFVDEMQEYLSTVMGAKGNEVTMKMYGVKLFKEKFYFPLKSAKQFMFEQNEVSGEVKIKNSGFTNKVVAKANNPVILSNFMEVWSGHVNDMSMYHAFVLPLEDFNRVFNYNSPKRENQPSVSVKGTIQNAYSPAAVNYVKGLITDLNGGARGDSTTGIINKLMGLFKKGSVFASLSVVVQQPSAIARAAALVDTKYFIGGKVDSKRHKALWEEVKKYAPVAIIKEMGYFDTNMGKSTQDYILGKEYSGFTEKMKALVTDSGYRDEVLSKAPALADEIAWCSIWDAVKRETKAKHPGLDVKGEPFLMLAGSRFTEVITKTQVYDSVLARSANMRSKDTGMKMATAFMAEPTTSINMITDALLQGKRGNRKYARNAIGAVIASQIFNSILVSFVYAGRDDDEDQTYWEKYAESLTGKVWDSLNPMTYIPFIKDIVSITQGYDVERSDMAIISDLWKAWENLGKSNVSIYRKVEGFAGSIAQIFGLPVKNIMRDVRGIWQTYESFLSGQQTTKAGIGYAVKSALPEWLGGGDTSNQNQLYDAYLSGDATQIARVESRYKDQSAINSAIRKALRENDPRIRAAAEARASGNLSEYTRLAKEIISEGHFSQDNVVAAINAEINAMSKDETTSTSAPKASGLYSADDFATAIASGDAAMANAVKADIIRTAQQNGKTAEEAEKSFASSAKSSLKELYLNGEISRQQVISGLSTYCGAEEQEAMADVRYWEFKRDYPDVYADDSWFDAYYEDVADTGMDIGLYMEYRNAVKNITGDGKKERRMAYIHSLPITSEQKDALYFAEGWAASRLGEAPWH